MLKNNYFKILLIFSVLPIFSYGIEARCASNDYGKFGKLITKLPTTRELIPFSLKNRILQKIDKLQKQTGINIDCNESNKLCASFDNNTTPTNVSAWIGFEFQGSEGKYFIATYSQKANELGNNRYSTLEWNKKHFWIHIGKNIPPFPIQPRFVGVDKESGNEWYSVDSIGYRMKDSGIDYSNYWENMSESVLILLIDPKTKEVKEYYLEYYDENDKYIGNYNIEIGDELESYFLGFRKGQEDREYLFSLENITTITDKITFSYEELYPGKDFNSTYGKELNLANVEFKYIFESYGKTRSSFTTPQPITKKSESTTNNSNSTTSKSVPLSGMWILSLLILFIALLKLPKNTKKDF
jgi:hypothetical protein